MFSFDGFFRALDLPPDTAVSADMAVVRKRYYLTVKTCHPDKVGIAGLEKTKFLNSEMERYAQWRTVQAQPPPWSPGPPWARGSASTTGPDPPPWSQRPHPPSWSRGTAKASARPDEGTRGSSQQSASSTDQSGNATTCPSCPLAPHCKNWARRHGQLGEARAQEYKFLYAASAGCLRCMQYYARLPNFDLQCRSSGQNARGWAAQAQQLTPAMEEFLQRAGL